MLCLQGLPLSHPNHQQFAWFMRFAQLTAQDHLQLIDRDSALGWDGRVVLVFMPPSTHGCKMPIRAPVKTARQQVFISTNAGAQF